VTVVPSGIRSFYFVTRGKLTTKRAQKRQEHAAKVFKRQLNQPRIQNVRMPQPPDPISLSKTSDKITNNPEYLFPEILVDLKEQTGNTTSAVKMFRDLSKKHKRQCSAFFLANRAIPLHCQKKQTQNNKFSTNITFSRLHKGLILFLFI